MGAAAGAPADPDAQTTSVASTSVASTSTADRATAFTLALFLVGCALLSVLPLPDALRPVPLHTTADLYAAAERVVAPPRMTLADVEDKLAGGASDGRDAPEGKGIDEEERELLRTRDASADVAALRDTPVPVQNAAAALPPVDRARVVARVHSPKAKLLRDEAAGVKARLHDATLMDNPCAAPGSTDAPCSKTALDPFFGTLDAIARGDTRARADVVVLGNSLIASDHVTDVLRTRLVERFGDAGRGYLLPERLSKTAGRRVRTGEGTPGWAIETFAMDDDVPGAAPVARGPFGFGGSLHVSTTADERTTWRTEGAARARLFYLEHKGQPAMRLEARMKDGGRVRTQVVARIEPVSSVRQDAGAQGAEEQVAGAQPADRSVEVKLPHGTTELSLVAEGPQARVYGVALENDRPGVTVDTIGVPAAQARLYVEATDAGVFSRQLALREPALFVAMLGGNEARSLSYGTLTEDGLATALGALLQRARDAAPDAACMVVAPIDAAKAVAGGEELLTRPELDVVIKAEQRVARAHGCAFFNLFEAMGGRGALSRFRAAGFLSDDLVHPTWRGGDVLGQLLADAVLDAYVATAPPQQPWVARGTRGAPQAPVFHGLALDPRDDDDAVVVVHAAAEHAPDRAPLSRVFDKLRALARGDVTRVAIGQFGASHTAGQMWTDRMRARLGERFGLRGRGFVAAGRASARLVPSGVHRALFGEVDVADGREVVLGGALGMSGSKVRLAPGARFTVEFCVRPPATKSDAAPALPPGCESDAPGTLDLSWLHTPDMGFADVFVDGRLEASIGPADRSGDSDVQVLHVPINGAHSAVEVVARAMDPEAVKAAVEAASSEDETSDAFLLPAGPVHLLGVSEEHARPGIVFDAVGLPGTTGMTPQRWRQDLLRDAVAQRQYDLVITAWGTNEAGIASLDEETYRHHFAHTLETLLAGSPGADCVVMGPSDRLDHHGDAWTPAPAAALVERVQRDVARSHGCAFYSLQRAMGGPGSMRAWVADGTANPDHVHFTRRGYERMADFVIDDLLSAYGYDEQLHLAAAQAAGAQTARAPQPAVSKAGG